MRQFSYPVHAPGSAEAMPPQRVAWPFPAMVRGSFFVVPEGSRHNSCKAAASQYGQRHGRVFECTHNAVGDLICKRIE
jgi:hypothetical protein